MLIFRYLAKEIFLTLIALTGILLFVFMSNQFVHYLSRAANGGIPAMAIIKLMLLELPNLLCLLLPLGFYIALLLSYGRLYADSEMTVLSACGYGEGQLLKHSFIFASFLFVIVSIMMIWASPLIAVERGKLIRASGLSVLIKTLAPGHFQSFGKKGEVVYIESVNRSHSKAKHLFFARLNQHKTLPQWQILWADEARTEEKSQGNETYLSLNEGQSYSGMAGSKQFEIAQFKQSQLRLPQTTLELKNDLRTFSTAALLPFNNSDLKKAAELQWRLSVPLMLFTLTLIAVPLSRIQPRSGKYLKLLPAILIYIVYANLMFISRNWLAAGKIPLWFGLTWIHLLAFALGMLLFFRAQKI